MSTIEKEIRREKLRAAIHALEFYIERSALVEPEVIIMLLRRIERVLEEDVVG
ncbi:MAG: hypothetical protein LVQ95_01260 [Candidatus Micrarchaeales archaeon]|nr:hypothetical protein [Candidatus Micrarchaeales archaeon]